MTAVAYYATPYEIATKLWMIPGALMGVLFPAFAVALVQDQMHASRLFNRAVIYTFITLFPFVLIIVTFSHEGLSLWLGSEFASNSTLVLQLLAIGVLINSCALVPFGMVQGAGRPDLTAKLHLIELPFYLLFLWWLLDVYGIVGAAIAWVVRVAIDALFLFSMVGRLLPSVSPFSLRPVFMVIVTFFLLALGALMPDLNIKWLYLLLVLVGFFMVTWFVILAADEKAMIRSRLTIIPISSRQE
jgi:O-antigen/teichoic acid export membrane protein